METTRQSILTLLSTKTGATANEISRLLNRTPADIRHHLSRLSKDGRVRIIGERPAQGRGRPSKVFALASKGNGLPNLFHEVLSQHLATDPEKKLESLAEQMAHQEPPSGGHITRRLYQAILQLNDLHYQAHWEAHADGPIITFNHCPYHLVIDNNPQLCQLDTFLLKVLLNAPAAQLDKRTPNPLGLPICRFRIG